MRPQASPIGRTLRHLTLTVLVSTLSACGAAPDTCAPGVGTPSSLFILYFGAAIRGRGDVTPLEWQTFVDDTITPNLPNGYTLLDAKGAWMSPRTHTTISEASKVLVVALPRGPDSLTAVNRVRTAYQIRFHQQLVGMTVEPVCASF